MKVVLSMPDLQIISMFQNITGSNVIDCYVNDELYFVVKEGQYGLAVGKKGIKIKNAEAKLKKKIKVIEHSDDLEKFIKNMIPEVKEISLKEGSEGKTIEIKIASNDRAKVIGKEGKNIKIIKNFLNRLFDIQDFKVK